MPIGISKASLMYYLDNAATTRPLPEVIAALATFLQGPQANPSSVHPWGVAQKKYLNQARETLAKLAHVPMEGIIFCASGTESDNLALKGSLVRSGKNQGALVISPLEHKAIVETAAWYHERGGTVRIVDVDPESGLIDLKDLEQKLGSDTKLVSIAHVHSETGIIQDLAAISKVLRSKVPKAIFHSDGVQAFGKIPLQLKDWGVDLYSVSGHKIHGLVGAGALIRCRAIPLEPLVHGGGQEFGLRSGTENLPAISALAQAALFATDSQSQHWAAVEQWSTQFMDLLSQKVPNLLRTTGSHTLPHILHLQIPGVLGEVLLHHLAAEGVLASQGSACQSKSKKLSPSLKALGLKDNQIRSTIRISLSPLELQVEPAEVVCAFVRALESLKSI